MSNFHITGALGGRWKELFSRSQSPHAHQDLVTQQYQLQEAGEQPWMNGLELLSPGSLQTLCSGQQRGTQREASKGPTDLLPQRQGGG